MYKRSFALFMALLCIGCVAMARPLDGEHSVVDHEGSRPSELDTEMALENRKLLQQTGECCCVLRENGMTVLLVAGVADESECEMIYGFYFAQMDCTDPALQQACDRAGGFEYGYA